MSWEDCGYEPGVINGPPKCSRRCGDCDGEHHFYVTFEDEPDDAPDDWEPSSYFQCKHCDVTAEMVMEDDFCSPDL